jgi:hypothetical protein
MLSGVIFVGEREVIVVGGLGEVGGLTYAGGLILQR